MAKKTKKSLKKYQSNNSQVITQPRTATFKGDATGVTTDALGRSTQGNVVWDGRGMDPRPPKGFQEEMQRREQNKGSGIFNKIKSKVNSVVDSVKPQSKKGGSISTKMKSKSKKK